MVSAGYEVFLWTAVAGVVQTKGFQTSTGKWRLTPSNEMVRQKKRKVLRNELYTYHMLTILDEEYLSPSCVIIFHEAGVLVIQTLPSKCQIIFF